MGTFDKKYMPAIVKYRDYAVWMSWAKTCQPIKMLKFLTARQMNANALL